MNPVLGRSHRPARVAAGIGRDLPDLQALKADPRVFAVMLGGVRTPNRTADELAEEIAYWGRRGIGIWAGREHAAHVPGHHRVHGPAGRAGDRIAVCLHDRGPRAGLCQRGGGERRCGSRMNGRACRAWWRWRGPTTWHRARCWAASACASAAPSIRRHAHAEYSRAHGSVDVRRGGRFAPGLCGDRLYRPLAGPHSGVAHRERPAAIALGGVPARGLRHRRQSTGAFAAAEGEPVGRAAVASDLASAGWRTLAGEGRADAGDWPPEASTLVFGMLRPGAAALGRRWRQNAVVRIVRFGRIGLVRLR